MEAIVAVSPDRAWDVAVIAVSLVASRDYRSPGVIPYKGAHTLLISASSRLAGCVIRRSVSVYRVTSQELVLSPSNSEPIISTIHPTGRFHNCRISSRCTFPQSLLLHSSPCHRSALWSADLLLRPSNRLRSLRTRCPQGLMAAAGILLSGRNGGDCRTKRSSPSSRPSSVCKPSQRRLGRGTLVQSLAMTIIRRCTSVRLTTSTLMDCFCHGTGKCCTSSRMTFGEPAAIPEPFHWSLDSSSGEANVLNSPIFDSVYGFGGNGPYIADISSFPDEWKTIVDIPGRQGGGCITNGPFKDRQIPMGPANHTNYTPHCLRRDISPWLITQTTNSSLLNWVLQATSHWDLDHRIEGLSLDVAGMTLHAGGHLGVGGMIGEMANMYSSPGDPLFYLHHAMLDKVWDTWQRKKWPARKADIGGPDTMWAYPYNYFGDIPYKNVTLNTPLNYPLMGGTIKINDVMDIRGGDLCYTYA